MNQYSWWLLIVLFVFQFFLSLILYSVCIFERIKMPFFRTISFHVFPSPSQIPSKVDKWTPSTQKKKEKKGEIIENGIYLINAKLFAKCNERRSEELLAYVNERNATRKMKWKICTLTVTLFAQNFNYNLLTTKHLKNVETHIKCIKICK